MRGRGSMEEVRRRRCLPSLGLDASDLRGFGQGPGSQAAVAAARYSSLDGIPSTGSPPPGALAAAIAKLSAYLRYKNILYHRSLHWGFEQRKHTELYSPQNSTECIKRY